MATAETTVTGRYLDLKGNAISSAYLTFRLLDVGADDDVTPQEVFARNPSSVQTDSSGDFSVVLWNNGSSDIDSVYEVKFPDNRTKQFIIPVGSAGGTIDLAALLALHQPSSSNQQSAVQENLNDFATDPENSSSFSASNWLSGLGFISATATLDFPSISSNHSEELTITVTGAAVGDVVIIGAPASIESNLTWVGYVSASNTVTVRLHNSAGGSVDPASATWKATVIN